MANSTTQFGGFLTNVGIAQQANTAALGLPWNITHMLIGDAGGEPSQTPDPTPKPTQSALVRQVYRAQLNALYQSPADPGVLVAELVLPPETGGWWIRELALEDANGNFIAVAKPAPSYKPLLAQGSGRTQTIRMHVVFGNLANVTLKIDPSIVLATRDYVDKAREAAELYARNQLKAHVEAADPHPQYLRRADVAKDAGPLAWLGTAGGTADALVLTLKSSEAALPAYAAGQRFQFQAVATNTGAVTARINGRPAVAVKKAGPGGLVDLAGGDVRAGALYDLNYDGTYFQLGGGVSDGKAFERFSFEASVGQKAFSAPHTVGNLIVMRNGREIIDYSADGQKVTLHTACNLGDTVVILAFGAFRSVDAYTKAEVDALLRTSSGLPVGSMLPFPRGVVPLGFIEVDGSVQDIAMYPDLAAYLGGAFNKGDEKAGEFRLPDSRGEFLRGWDHGRGVDVGRTVGSNQDQASRDHKHATPVAGSATNLSIIKNNVWPHGDIVLNGTANTVASSGGGAASSAVFLTGPMESQSGENRPRNLAVMWCIKAWNAPVNQGQIDVAALVAELTALRSSTPVGAILPFPKAEVPAGYLELDGSEQSIATYPDLAAYLGATYNKGDEKAGNFRLPDYRGEFMRGWDHGRGIDVGRALGSWQNFELQEHDHVQQGTNTVPNNTGAVGALNVAAVSGLDGGRTRKSGGAETRPRNLAVMWCIKAWSAPVNQGHIDVAALAAEAQAVRSLALSAHRGLSVSATGTNSLIAIRARSLLVGDGAQARRLSRIDLSINLATSGLGGLDIGVVAPASWYSLWVATNGEAAYGIAALVPVVTGNTTAGSAVITGIANTASMRPGMPFSGASFPSGVFVKSVDSPSQITASAPANGTGATSSLRFVYEPVLQPGYWAVRVGAISTDATANKYPLCFDQIGKKVTLSPRAGTNVAANIFMAQGVQGTISGAGVVVAVDPVIPPTASSIEVFISTQSGSGGTVQVGRAGTLLNAVVLSITNEANQFSSGVVSLDGAGRSLTFASNLAAGVLGCRGWEDEL